MGYGSYSGLLGRRAFIGGSDARIIMSNDSAALIRLWQEKRGEVVHEDLSGNLIVQLGKATEDLNRTWYERNTGRTVEDVQRLVRRHRCRNRCRFRSQVHAALVLLRGGCHRKAHGPAPAQ